jgi:hypothetical protein
MTETKDSMFEALFDDLEPAPLAAPEPAMRLDLPPDDAAAIDHVKAISDRLLKRSADIVEGSLHFAELDPETMADMRDPPDEWVLEIGEQAARKRLRLAKAAWAASKDMPGGIKLAADFVASETKARSLEKMAPRSLNVAILVTGEAKELPRRIIDMESEE